MKTRNRFFYYGGMLTSRMRIIKMIIQGFFIFKQAEKKLRK